MYLQHITIVTDSLPCCRWAFPSFYSPYTEDLRGDPAYGSQVFSAVTGMDRTEEEMLRLVGERGVNLERSILAREGRRRKHDLSWHDYYYRLFKRWLSKEKLERVMDKYYEMRGWSTRTGIPTKEKLEELGLGDVARELSGLNPA